MPASHSESFSNLLTNLFSSQVQLQVLGSMFSLSGLELDLLALPTDKALSSHPAPPRRAQHPEDGMECRWALHCLPKGQVRMPFTGRRVRTLALILVHFASPH